MPDFSYDGRLSHQIQQAQDSPLGLVPQSDLDKRFLLRPRYFELLYDEYVATWNLDYQDLSWRAFLAVNETCRDENGKFHGVSDVMNGSGGESLYDIPGERVFKLLEFGFWTQWGNRTVPEQEQEGVWYAGEYEGTRFEVEVWPENRTLVYGN